MYKDEIPLDTPAFEAGYETERGKPMPSINHSYIQANLIFALRLHFSQLFTIVSEVDLQLPNAKRPTVPDLAIFNKQVLTLSKDVTKVKDAPLTTIEILSPSQTIEELTEKIFENYFPAGVKSAWLVIPSARTVSIYTPDERFITYAAGKFTDPTNGISLEVDAVFEGLV